jgi:head-tail adaptor
MIGDFRHLVTFQDMTEPSPDGVGGFTQTPVPLDPPTWYVQIAPLAAHDLERISAGGSVVTTGSHIVRGRYHPGVSTKTRMLFSGRTFSITGTRTPDERGIFMELTAVEQVTP